MNQGFFDPDALEGKNRRDRAAWRCKLLGALCKHLVKAHSEDAILVFECVAAIYVIFMVPFQLRRRVRGRVFWARAGVGLAPTVGWS